MPTVPGAPFTTTWTFTTHIANLEKNKTLDPEKTKKTAFFRGFPSLSRPVKGALRFY
jgi:hypothetical protein